MLCSAVIVKNGRQSENSADLAFIFDKLRLDAVVIIETAKGGEDPLSLPYLETLFRRREDLGKRIDVRDVSHGES